MPHTHSYNNNIYICAEKHTAPYRHRGEIPHIAECALHATAKVMLFGRMVA